MPGSLNVPGNTSINGDWEVFKMAKMGMRYDADKTDQQQLECGSYYDALDKLCSVVVKMNKYAMDGMEIKNLQQNFQKIAPVFLMLCGEEKAKPAKKIGRPKKDILRVQDEWGLCPTCGKKCIKVKPETVLANYPMFCKVCKRDYLVSWKLE